MSKTVFVASENEARIRNAGALVALLPILAVSPTSYKSLHEFLAASASVENIAEAIDELTERPLASARRQVLEREAPDLNSLISGMGDQHRHTLGDDRNGNASSNLSCAFTSNLRLRACVAPTSGGENVR